MNSNKDKNNNINNVEISNDLLNSIENFAKASLSIEIVKILSDGILINATVKNSSPVVDVFKNVKFCFTFKMYYFIGASPLVERETIYDLTRLFSAIGMESLEMEYTIKFEEWLERSEQ